MLIRTATAPDAPLIHQLANDIWWPTYRGIISDEQISFMLNDMYSVDSLIGQFLSTRFLIAERDGQPLAFAAISIEDQAICKLHKLYILPAGQGKGTGKALVDHIIGLAKNNGSRMLELNVNRGNPAIGFYRKIGFRIFKEVDIPYHGFILNDYVMRMDLS